MLQHYLVYTNSNLFDIAMLILRVSLGICFIIHALGKLGMVGSGNMEGFTSWLDSLNVPFPALQARLAMLSELLGGFCLAIGFLTRPACFILFITMMVASFVGHRGAGYLITNEPPGMEYSLNLGIITICLAFMGPGHFSLDHFLFAP